MPRRRAHSAAAATPDKPAIGVPVATPANDPIVSTLFGRSFVLIATLLLWLCAMLLGVTTAVPLAVLPKVDKPNARPLLVRCRVAVASWLLWLGARILRAIVDHRKLRLEEREAAALVFGSVLDLNRIGIADKAPYVSLFKRIPGFEDSYFTAMDLIVCNSPDGIELPVLIHELTHVWQSLDGPHYMAECILERARFGERVYEFRVSRTARGSLREGYCYEQQAAILESLYKMRYEERRPAAQWRHLQALADQIVAEAGS